jgi:hypothetical protein
MGGAGRDHLTGPTKEVNCEASIANTLINNNYGSIGEALALKLVRLYARSLKTEHLLQASPKAEML